VTGVCFAAAHTVKAMVEVAKKQPLTRLALLRYAAVLKTNAHKVLAGLYAGLVLEAKNAQDPSYKPSPEAVIARTLVTDVLVCVYNVWSLLDRYEAGPMAELIFETVLKSVHLLTIWNKVVANE